MAISVTSAGVNGLSVTSKTGVKTPQPSAPSVGSFCWAVTSYDSESSIKTPSSGSYLSIIVGGYAGEYGPYSTNAPASYAGGATVINSPGIAYTSIAILYRTS